MEHPTKRGSIVACNRKRSYRGCVTITGVTILSPLFATVLFVLLFPAVLGSIRSFVPIILFHLLRITRRGRESFETKEIFTFLLG